MEDQSVGASCRQRRKEKGAAALDVEGMPEDGVGQFMPNLSNFKFIELAVSWKGGVFQKDQKTML